MTPLLFKFLTQYIAWVEAGADPEVFNPSHGLCDNLRYWCNALHDMEAITLSQHLETGLKFEELVAALVEEESLHPEFPFGGYDVYMRESEQRTHHLNPLRIDWIHRMLDTAPLEVK